MKTIDIKIRDLRTNNGQLEGLPRNPRKISKKQLEKLKKSLTDAPEMLRLRELIAVEHGGEYIVICGNQRLEAAKALGMDTLPVKVLPADTPVEKLREYAIKDNLPFGEDDWEIIASDWDTAELEEWGMEVPEEWDMTEDEVQRKEKSIIPEVEEWLNKAMAENISEFVEQIDTMMDRGWLASGLTRGCAKARFIRSLYYGERYPQKMAYVYAPELYFLKDVNNGSYYSVMKGVADGKKAGIAGFRTLTGDYMLTRSISNQYRVGGGGGGDFPADVAKKIIEENANRGRVLDPCHGWGGRLIGAMLARASEYFGIDPSPVAHRAVSNIYGDFSPYVDTKATLITKPYEDVDEDIGLFDMALTSPPYFDVEKYDGDDTSTKRYSNFDLWVERFYTPLIVNTMKRLKVGGSFFLQVGSQKYPLKQKAIDICDNNGYKATIITEDLFHSHLNNNDGTNRECLIKIINK